MKPINSNQKTFDSDLQEEGITLVDFWAVWCGPCKMIAPILEEIGEEHPEIKILKIDVDENEELAQDYGIRSIPTVFIFKDKQLVDRTVGALSKLKFSEILIPYLT